MKHIAGLMALAALAAGAPAQAHCSADHHAMDAADTALLQAILADERRAEDRARDRYRNPAETLAFFRVEPGLTVAEYAPGGGWYTKVLLPYLAEDGAYVALNGDTDTMSFRDDEQEQQARGWAAGFPARAAEMTGVGADRVRAFESDEVPEELAGEVDRVLIFRSIHGLLNGNRADGELRNIRAMLADDGMVGVVQHRARADAPYAASSGARGYLREQDVVSLFELHGFELVDRSEVNANPNDPADWEGGVWTLPPVLRYGEEDRDRYLGIGESDRMTLLFRKAD
jgi:predicted methyltransferase